MQMDIQQKEQKLVIQGNIWMSCTKTTNNKKQTLL